MAAKKTVKKKTARKRSPAKKSAEKGVLVCANGTECFWVHNGPILKDIEELNTALRQMSEEMFSYHVGNGKNDFAEWVEHILNDRALATRLRKARKLSTAAATVGKRLKEYRR